MEPVNIWTLPEEERNAIFKIRREGYAQFMALSDEEREAIYYKSFLKAISSCDEARQEKLKEDYKIEYAAMLKQNESFDEKDRIRREKNPNGLQRSYGNCYHVANFTVYWAEKRLEYNG